MSFPSATKLRAGGAKVLGTVIEIVGERAMGPHLERLYKSWYNQVASMIGLDLITSGKNRCGRHGYQGIKCSSIPSVMVSKVLYCAPIRVVQTEYICTGMLTQPAHVFI